MIRTENLSKYFTDRNKESITALEHLSCEIPKNCIFGMVGSNGAGKSTLLRLLAGVYKPDGGTALIDNEPIWENPAAKAKITFVSDETFVPAGATMDTMAAMYRGLLPHFNTGKYRSLSDALQLGRKRPLTSFSKGMRRQAMTILALASEPDYILFDETFDGLDPVMRTFIKKLIIDEMADRGASAIMTSHSLRELEDTCDQLALLHKGGIVLQSDITDLKTSRFKVQIAFSRPFTERDITIALGIKPISFKKSGSVASLIVSGDREHTVRQLSRMDPAVLDVLPLSLEEVFTYEMEALGYAFETERSEQ